MCVELRNYKEFIKKEDKNKRAEEARRAEELIQYERILIK
jgi:hypothetical protein